MSVLKTDTERGARTCVVVSYWTGLPVRRLHRLLQQMKMIDAGSPFDVVVVCNGGDKRPLTLPRRFDGLKPRILNRENDNYNLGAWDHGWRNAPGYDYYLFLQDDCFLKDSDWLYAFERRMDFDRGAGLLGEVESNAGVPWEFTWAMRAKRSLNDSDSKYLYAFTLSLFKEHGIDLGPTAHHIPSIILFTRRDVLEEVGGFRRFGPTYEDAVAAEVIFSLEIVARGHRIAKIHNAPFRFIGHAEWSPDRGHGERFSWRTLLLEWFWKVKDALKPRLGIRRKSRKYAYYRPFPHPSLTPSQFPRPLAAGEAAPRLPVASWTLASGIEPIPAPSFTSGKRGEGNHPLATGQPVP